MQVRSDEEKFSVQQCFREIKQKFKNYIGLITDKLKPCMGIQMMGTPLANSL